MHKINFITFRNFIFVALLTLQVSLPVYAQSTATLQGTISDSQGAIISGAKVTARNLATGVERQTQTDSDGNYVIPALPVGTYRLEVQQEGFSTQIINEIKLEVAQTTVQNGRLEVGDIAQEVTVTSDAPIVETATTSIGQVINQRTVQEIPLNGRHFVDLGLLIPGSVTPPQNGFLTAPLRGQGSTAFNTAGNREDTVNFQINGINLNDQVQNQITFQPSINTVQEFKVDNSTFSAQYGRSSGAIVNIATRSGTNAWHGEVFEFLRNDALDARNFFDTTISPFKRNQFGANLGGPILENRAFFFFSYEGLRQRQGLTINSPVPTDAQRATVTDPVVQNLIDLIPRANFFAADGSGFFRGAATAPVDIDQWTGDITYVLGPADNLHGYYALQRDNRIEPTLQGNSVPDFGDTRESRRQLFTLNETHTFGPNLLNEVRLGFNRIRINFTPNVLLNPADLGINNGINEPLGLPQIAVTGGPNIGGPAGFPQSRADTTLVLSDSINYLRSSHSLVFGGEFRTFLNNNLNRDTGSFTFASMGDFLNGRVNAFNIALGEQVSSIAQKSFSFFVQDSYKVRRNLTLELGLRYDLNLSPTERFDRFVSFDPATASLVQTDQPYQSDKNNIQPRIGIAWDPFKDGKTSVRAAYAILVDQPVTNAVTGLTANPPFGDPRTITSTLARPVTLTNALDVALAGGLAPASIDDEFTNAYVQSWNLNIQREIMSGLALTVAYVGSKGTHLRISRNINQFVNNVRPFTTLSATSPILPGATLGNITEIGSGGDSSYNALWVTANKRFARGLQFNASYTFSKSIDTNSQNSQGVIIQNSFDVGNSRGLSDYDARHRFVINAIYEFPFKGNRLVEGWELSNIVQLQSGNPVNIVLSVAGLTGVGNTVTPDVIGPISINGTPVEFFDTTVFRSSITPLDFGNLGRNVVIGPGFNNVDFSVIKNTKLTEKINMQFRTEFFNLFNHTNFGQPGRIISTDLAGNILFDPTTGHIVGTFGQIIGTRVAPGDSGSSRQIQFALKFLF